MLKKVKKLEDGQGHAYETAPEPTAPKPASPVSSSVTRTENTIIGKNISIEGSIRGSEHLFIDGSIRGNI